MDIFGDIIENPSLYYDKEINPISRSQFLKLAKDNNYVKINKTYLIINGIGYYISTAWTGLDMSIGSPFQSPVVFETAIFYENDLDIYGRSHTELQALKIHNNAVKEILNEYYLRPCRSKH